MSIYCGRNQMVMVTTNGITENEQAKDVNQNIILDDLF